MLMDQMGKMYDANEHWKDEILDQMQSWKDEIIHEFHVVSEHNQHEALGANKDRIESHENRLQRVEDHLHLAPL